MTSPILSTNATWSISTTPSAGNGLPTSIYSYGKSTIRTVIPALSNPRQHNIQQTCLLWQRLFILEHHDIAQCYWRSQQLQLLYSIPSHQLHLSIHHPLWYPAGMQHLWPYLPDRHHLGGSQSQRLSILDYNYAMLRISLFPKVIPESFLNYAGPA